MPQIPVDNYNQLLICLIRYQDTLHCAHLIRDLCGINLENYKKVSSTFVKYLNKLLVFKYYNIHIDSIWLYKGNKIIKNYNF